MFLWVLSLPICKMHLHWVSTVSLSSVVLTNSPPELNWVLRSMQREAVVCRGPRFIGVWGRLEFTASIIASGDVTGVISPFAALCSEVKDINRRLGPKL